MPDETATACSTSQARGEPVLELGDLRPHGQHAALEDRGDRRRLLRADVRPAYGPPRPVFARYHAIVRSSPSSSSTFASKPSSVARLVHVRDAQLDVEVVERLEDDLAGAAR